MIRGHTFQISSQLGVGFREGLVRFQSHGQGFILVVLFLLEGFIKLFSLLQLAVCFLGSIHPVNHAVETRRLDCRVPARGLQRSRTCLEE